MATVTKPIALDESFNTTEQTPRNLADVLAEGIGDLVSAVSRIAPQTVYDELDKLNDVQITSATSGQVLKWNGSKWINANESGGGATITLTVSCDSAFQGETVTISKGGVSLTESVGAGLSVSFTVPELGTWTISNSLNANTDTIDIQFYGNYTYSLIALPDGSTITPTDDIQILLHCANIWDKNYTTLSELLADTTTLSAVISSNNAIDYLVRSTTFAGGGLVPKMTSNTTPSGVASSKTEISSIRSAWYAFDNDDTTYYCSTGTDATGEYLRYDFGSKKKISSFKVYPRYRDANQDLALKSYKIQGSDDNFVSDVHDLFSETLSNTNVGLITRTLTTEGNYRYYQLIATSDTYNSNHQLQIFTLQFYSENACDNATFMSYIGLNNYASNTLLADSTWKGAIWGSAYKESVLNVKVPTMTDNTTPSGECFANNNSADAYKAFSGSSALSWLATTTSGLSIGYKFTKPVTIYMAEITNNTSGERRINAGAKFERSDDNSTWTTLFTTTSPMTTYPIRYMDFANIGSGQYIRLSNISSPTLAPQIFEMQFYGRADV